MTTTQDALEYDEDKAIKFIQNYLPQELKEKFSEDDINYIIDVVYDFYEDKGLMDENGEDDDVMELDEDELVDYVLKSVKKDQIANFSRDEISFIVKGELEYCESIGIFD